MRESRGREGEGRERIEERRGRGSIVEREEIEEREVASMLQTARVPAV